MAESRRVRDALTDLESTLWLPGERLPEWEHKTQGGKNCQAVTRAMGLLRDALTSSPWRPIEECGELEEKIDIMYLVWAQNEEFSGPCIANRRNGRWELTDKPEFFEVSDITHVHQAGPIRGPGEG